MVINYVSATCEETTHHVTLPYKNKGNLMQHQSHANQTTKYDSKSQQDWKSQLGQSAVLLSSVPYCTFYQGKCIWNQVPEKVCLYVAEWLSLWVILLLLRRLIQRIALCQELPLWAAWNGGNLSCCRLLYSEIERDAIDKSNKIKSKDIRND